MEHFTDNLTAGNVKAAMKDAGAVSADLWQVAPVFFDTLTKVQADPGFKHLSPELRKALAELLAGIKKPEGEQD